MSESVIDTPQGSGNCETSAKRTAREVDSCELLRGENELLIRHGDELYRLRLTRNGKLILQK